MSSSSHVRKKLKTKKKTSLSVVLAPLPQKLEAFFSWSSHVRKTFKSSNCRRQVMPGIVKNGRLSMKSRQERAEMWLSGPAFGLHAYWVRPNTYDVVNPKPFEAYGQRRVLPLNGSLIFFTWLSVIVSHQVIPEGSSRGHKQWSQDRRIRLPEMEQSGNACFRKVKKTEKWNRYKRADWKNKAYNLNQRKVPEGCRDWFMSPVCFVTFWENQLEWLIRFIWLIWFDSFDSL